MAARRQRRRARQFSLRWENLIGGDDQVSKLDVLLRAAGFDRAGAVRAWFTRDGAMTVRFVWRRRAEGRTQTHEIVYRGIEVPPALRAAA